MVNLYTSDGTLVNDRTVILNTSSLTFDATENDFTIQSNDATGRIFFNDLPIQDTPQILGVKSGGQLTYMNTSSISGGGGTPDTPLNSLQFNSASAFGGSELYYDEANSRIGFFTDSPSRPVHISSSLGLPVRVQTSAATSRIQLMHGSTSGASGNVVLLGSTGSNDFKLEQDDSGLKVNQYVSSSGEVHFPRIASGSQAKYLTYNTSSGEVTYHDGGSGGAADTVNLVTASANADYRVLLVDNTGLTDEIIYVDNDNGLTFNPSLNSLQSKGEVIAYYSSDRRLKDNLIPIPSPLEKLSKINGYEFDWNENQQVYQGHDIGVVAQEIEEILPELVQTRDNGYKAVKYEKLTAFLVSVVKEQQLQIEDLKSRIDNLEK